MEGNISGANASNEVLHSLPPASGDSTATNGSGESAAPSAEPAKVEEMELSREEILNAKDTVRVKVSVDEWKKGGFVWVQTPTAADRDFLERSILTGTKEDGSPLVLGKEAIRASVVAMSVINADGTRKFKPEDIEALSKKSIVPMNRIYNQIVDIAIITEKDVEELAKNSGAASKGTS